VFIFYIVFDPIVFYIKKIVWVFLLKRFISVSLNNQIHNLKNVNLYAQERTRAVHIGRNRSEIGTKWVYVALRTLSRTHISHTYINRNLHKQIIRAQNFMVVLRPIMASLSLFRFINFHSCRKEVVASCILLPWIVSFMSALLRHNSMLSGSMNRRCWGSSCISTDATK